MIVERITESSGSNKDTYTHRGYQKAHRLVNELMLLGKYGLGSQYDTLDLFARTCPWADFRNDLNPIFKEQGLTNMCMDALEAAKTFDNSSIALIFCDPPFSPRMATDKYQEVGSSNLYTNPEYMANLGQEIYRILEPGGFVIKAGFNSNPLNPKLEPIAIYLSHYHGSRNDVIFSVWQKKDTQLNVYFD
jgi:hypothetical protein